MAYQPKSYRKFIVGAVSTAVVASSFAGVAGAASFKDVNANYKEAVDFVVSKGINGFSATEFGTYENIKRVDAAVFVAKVLDLNTTSAPDAGFTDVPARAKGAVNALKAAGITSGKSATTFGAQDYITRGELAVWIQKGFGLEAGYQNLAFNDVPSQYANAVNALVSNNVTKGTSASTFGTYDNAKRGDFAIFLQRAHDAKGNGDKPVPVNALTITGDSQGNKLTNGKSKLYTVKFINPVSGKPIENARLNVTFEENVGTDFGPERNATVTNAEGQAVTPYQANDGQEREIEIQTDKNGVATFEVTGSNTSVTPIVFLDGSYQEWDTKGGNPQIPNTQDSRFDKNTELYAKAQTVTFGVTEYAITVEGQRTDYAAVALERNNEIIQNNGREYLITVKKPDGTAFAGGEVNVGIYQLLDGKLGNEPSAAYLYRILTDKSEVALNKANDKNTQGTVTLDSKGQAKIWIASRAVNDNAEPIVWIDQNAGTNPQGGTYEAGEPVSDHTKVAPTNFQPVRVDNLNLGAELKVEENLQDGWKDFTLTLLNQSGKPFIPERAIKANVTFTIENTGTHPILIDTDHVRKQNITNTSNVDLSSREHIRINVGGYLTISGDIDDVNQALFAAYAIGGTSSLNVRTSAVLDDSVKYESKNVTVTAELKDVVIPFSKTFNVTATKFDSDNNAANGIDSVVLEFDTAVSGQEAGDFNINGTKATSVTKEGRKLIVKFPGTTVDSATTITYDPNGAGGSVLVDEFGTKVQGFNADFPVVQ
jgi:hypothetical protein